LATSQLLSVIEARAILQNAEQVCSAIEVSNAVQRVAAEITELLAERNPLVLSVMSGAVVFAGQLLPLLRFPLTADYVHVTRYGGALSGSHLEWKRFPENKIAGRTVLVLDDILDEGHTLCAVRGRVLAAGAEAFYSAVFANKQISVSKPIAADFVGIQVPDRYVFGFGMDVIGAWRNLPAVYALGSEQP
jgi:hypoxanthine phosphoribosyltransferase